MSTEDPQLKIGDLSVERVRVGQYTLGHVVIDENLSAVFKMNDDGSLPAPQCTACQLSHLIECRDLVCPDIKKHDPQVSCRDAIEACMDLACRGAVKLRAVAASWSSRSDQRTGSLVTSLISQGPREGRLCVTSCGCGPTLPSSLPPPRACVVSAS